MANVDSSKRKPRRTAGTPSYHYRNKFALAVIGGCCALFGIFTLTDTYKNANQKILEACATPDIEFQERKALFGFASLKRGEDILKILEEAENLKKEQ